MSRILTPPSKFEYMLLQDLSATTIQVLAESRSEAKHILEKLRISGRFELRYIGRVKEEDKEFKKAKFGRY